MNKCEMMRNCGRFKGGTMDNYFKCGVCGSMNPTVLERNKCENECLKKANERVKRLKENSIREIENAIGHVDTLMRIHNKTYGENNNAFNLNNCFELQFANNVLGKAFIY